MLECITNCRDGHHCLLARYLVGSVSIIVMYKHPKFSKQQFQVILEDVLKSVQGKTVIIGDINIDLLNEHNIYIYQLFEKYNFYSQLTRIPSTNLATQIDCCFTNFETTAWLYETYYSYHKSICITFPKK
jgi:hypothetical protein